MSEELKNVKVGEIKSSTEGDTVILDLSEVGGLRMMKATDDDILDKYEGFMNQDVVFDVVFSQANKSGDLTRMEGGVTLRLHARDIATPGWDRRARLANGSYAGSLRLGMSYRVQVYKIDRVNKRVYLTQRSVQADVREHAIEILKSALSERKNIKVPAKVIGVCPGDSDYCLVDIAGIGIPGFISCKEWSTAYTSELDVVVVPGEEMEVVVTHFVKWSGAYGISAMQNVPWFGCSRRRAMDNTAWERVGEAIHEGQHVRVKCINMNSKNFFGVIEGFRDVNAYCEYPKADAGFKIECGREYVGYVYSMDASKGRLMVRIISEVQ